MLCKDCVSAKLVVNYTGEIIGAHCNHPDNCDVNPVTGQLERYRCEFVNKNGKCKIGRFGMPEANRLPQIRSKYRYGGIV